MSCENVFKHGEKLKKCDQCDFTFSDAGILKHTVEKSQTSATNMIFKKFSIVISSHNESFHVFESE